jgi:hypothetical protein
MQGVIEMSRKIVISLCAALAVFAFGTMTVGSASGANLRITKHFNKLESFLAIYGYPGTGVGEMPVGAGLGLNFGFGQNMLFQGGPASFTTAKGVKSESCEGFIGGTLMSNNTGVEKPLSFGIEFADFQCNNTSALGKASAYSDTQDQKWIAEICEPKARLCHPEPLHTVTELERGSGEEPTVKIEHVAIDVGPGLVVQGAVWGTWENGKPPCIKLLKNRLPEPLKTKT